jgi:hypothetical protein
MAFSVQVAQGERLNVTDNLIFRKRVGVLGEFFTDLPTEAVAQVDAQCFPHSPGFHRLLIDLLMEEYRHPHLSCQVLEYRSLGFGLKV